MRMLGLGERFSDWFSMEWRVDVNEKCEIIKVLIEAK